jgi:hypothetical protein
VTFECDLTAKDYHALRTIAKEGRRFVDSVTMLMTLGRRLRDWNTSWRA